MLPVTVFSDFTCAYCYATEAALWRRAERGDVELHFRAYELYPALLPAEPAVADPAASALAAELGLELSPPDFRPRTAKAHEAARFAAERGVERAMRGAIYSAFWTAQKDIGRIDVLVPLIEPLGVDPEELRIALDIDRYRETVEHDREVATRLRIQAVPTLFLGTGPGATILVGAQTPAALDAALATR